MKVTISPVNMEDRRKIGVRPGDTVRVWQKIQEKGKTRLQVFEGLVLARKHGNEAGATFTVRKVTSNVGVEKIFPLYSPMIDKIEIVRRAKVRRAKLYYIRKKFTREIKRQMRNMRMMNISTVSDIEEKETATKKENKEETQKENQETKVESASTDVSQDVEKASEKVSVIEEKKDKKEDRKEELAEEVKK